MIDVLYYSGTGNSLGAARALAERLGAGDAVPLESREAGGGADGRSAVVVFPVHWWTLPRFVARAVAAGALDGYSAVYAAATSGGDAGNAFRDLDAALARRGGRLETWTHLPLGDNSLMLKTPPRELAARLEAMPRAIDAFAARILAVPVLAAGAPAVRRPHLDLGKRVAGPALKAAARAWYRLEDKRADAGTCSRCGLCAGVCPHGAVSLEEGPPRWSAACEECFACINACPRQAISFGRVRPAAESQYRFPGTTAAMLRRSARAVGDQAIGTQILKE